MALWDRIRESAQTMRAQLEARKNELKSGAFRDASMAMCALVAVADGTVDPVERRRVAHLIANNEVLRSFPADDLQRRFDAHPNTLTADFELGKVSVMQEVAKARKRPAEARAVFRIGIVIGVLGRLALPGRQHTGVLLTIGVGVLAALAGTAAAAGVGVAETDGVDWIELAVQVALAAGGVALVERIKGR